MPRIRSRLVAETQHRRLGERPDGRGQNNPARSAKVGCHSEKSGRLRGANGRMFRSDWITTFLGSQVHKDGAGDSRCCCRYNQRIQRRNLNSGRAGRRHMERKSTGLHDPRKVGKSNLHQVSRTNITRFTHLTPAVPDS